MQTTQPVSNPFALLLNPAEVFAEIERSDRLNRLASRICRPLDKPTLGAPEAAAGDPEVVSGGDAAAAI